MGVQYLIGFIYQSFWWITFSFPSSGHNIGHGAECGTFYCSYRRVHCFVWCSVYYILFGFIIIIDSELKSKFCHEFINKS